MNHILLLLLLYDSNAHHHRMPSSSTVTNSNDILVQTNINIRNSTIPHTYYFIILFLLLIISLLFTSFVIWVVSFRILDMNLHRSSKLISFFGRSYELINIQNSTIPLIYIYYFSILFLLFSCMHLLCVWVDSIYSQKFWYAPPQKLKINHFFWRWCTIVVLFLCFFWAIIH